MDWIGHINVYKQNAIVIDKHILVSNVQIYADCYLGR